MCAGLDWSQRAKRVNTSVNYVCVWLPPQTCGRTVRIHTNPLQLALGSNCKCEHLPWHSQQTAGGTKLTHMAHAKLITQLQKNG